jgi:Tol biopolymer transport system component
MKPIRGGLLSGVGVVVVLLAVLPATSWATYPGANGRIAFVGWTGELDQPAPWDDTELFTVLPDGSRLQQLTNDSSSELDPSWSADGLRLAYIDGAGENRGVFTMHADGTHQRRVTLGPLAEPQFSRGGRRIVYEKHNSFAPPGSIFIVRIDGTGNRRLVGDDAERPVYAPSGPRRIAFDRVGVGGRRDGIWTVRPDGTHQRRITHPGEYVQDEIVDWSPDGRQIVFTRCKAEIHVCRLTSLRAVWPDGSHEHAIQGIYFDEPYSPSGRRVLRAAGNYDRDLEWWWCIDIYTISISGSDRRDLTHNCEDYNNGGPTSHASDPSWQPIPQP